MDNFLLHAVTMELARAATGLRLASVQETPARGLLLIFEEDAAHPPASPAREAHSVAGEGGGPAAVGDEGRPVERRDVALVVETSGPRARLHIARRFVPALRADLSGLAALVASRLRGTILAAVRKEPSERVVELVFQAEQGETRLVAELLGRAPNLILVSSGGTVIASTHRGEGEDGPIEALARARAAELRRLVPGSLYRRPRGSPALRRLGGEEGEGAEGAYDVAGRCGVFEADEARVVAIAERAREERRPLSAALTGGLIGLPPVVAEDVERLEHRGVDPWEALSRWTRALRAMRFHPTLYAVCRPEDLPVDRVPQAATFFALPLELGAPAPALLATHFPTANDAAEEYFNVRCAAEDFVRRKQGLLGILRRETGRLDRLLGNLRSDLSSLAAQGTCRRQAEAILAGLSVARREGEFVIVPDPYSESAGEGAVVRIRIDPSRSLQASAAALFAREAKAERSRRSVSERLAKVDRRGRILEGSAATLEAARTIESLAAAEEGLRAVGLVLAPDKRLRRHKRAQLRVTPVAPPRLAGIRRYVSADGLEILVGKSGRENERLTFQIAGPDDFWFHAAGAAGAHVVVRNPARLAFLPERTLREAAGLAAAFSRAGRIGRSTPRPHDLDGPPRTRPRPHDHKAPRSPAEGRRRKSGRGGDAAGASRVEVHLTRRKHVRKARGAPPGTVVLRKFTTVFVEPSDASDRDEGV